jgi:sporulation protein YlmC with PRC-barrel domain
MSINVINATSKLHIITGNSYLETKDALLKQTITSLNNHKKVLVLDFTSDNDIFDKVNAHNKDNQLTYSSYEAYMENKNDINTKFDDIMVFNNFNNDNLTIDDVFSTIELNDNINRYYTFDINKLYGLEIFDDIGKKSGKITDIQLILSRVHGQYICVIDNGEMKLMGNYDKLKEHLPESAFKGFRRRNASVDFMYWTLEQCIEMLKTISDNLKINM